MTWLPDIKQRIVSALLDEPANQFELADRLGEPAFRIHGELAALKRQPYMLVRDRFGTDQIRWELTDRGINAAVALDDSQLPLWERTI
jgi:hypothetical protein